MVSILIILVLVKLQISKEFTDLGRFNEGVMKITNISSPKHGAVIHLTQSEAEKLAAHWQLEMKF